MTHTLPSLPYAYNALEPHIDERTMIIHHTKHHQTYVDKLNAALASHPELADRSAEDLVKNLASMPDDIKNAVRNHGGGHVNHTFFWQVMAANAGGEPHGKIAEAIIGKWSTFEKFEEAFAASCMTIFGSGWTWLVLSNGKLEIVNTPNQDSPITVGKWPVLGINLWEHSHYLLYNNRRADYIKAWWNVVNWSFVEDIYVKATGK